MGRVIHAWAILWRSENKLEGYREHLAGDPVHASRTLLFRTRTAALIYNEQRYGYIRNRPDLRREPHGWKMPKVVRVEIDIKTKGE
jgi:hypothetical protein